MAYQQVPLELIRDGQCTPWGFRMTGGADIGAPLVIQKVSFGSPAADGQLQKGDIILCIRDQDATKISHQKATDLIAKAGSTLKLIVARSATNSSPVASTPSTPVGTPLRPLLTLSDGNQNIFKPLPTTNFGTQRQRRSSTESFTSTTSSDTEKDLIVNQPYRSTPLILPSAKPSKDIPVGSYLRFDPLNRRTSTPPNLGPRFDDPFMLTKVQEAILEAAHSSGAPSPRRTPTPDIGLHNGSHIYHRQYNSPINMYSNQAIVEAIAAQTVMTKKPPLQEADALLDNKKLLNIKQSPTYQLIHDEEWKKAKLVEHEPLKEHVYNVVPRDSDHYKSEIHQSDSFKAIMHDLKGISDF